MDAASIQEVIQVAEARMELLGSTVLDNVQEYIMVYEQGLGRQNEMKVGTAARYVCLQDCKPGALDAKDYYPRSGISVARFLPSRRALANVSR
jgi:hypothetical protein